MQYPVKKYEHDTVPSDSSSDSDDHQLQSKTEIFNGTKPKVRYTKTGTNNHSQL